MPSLRPLNSSHLVNACLAQYSLHSMNLGAQPPDMDLKAINTGLNKGHLGLDKFGRFNPFAYRFSRALVDDLWEIFGQQEAHGLFLCEMPSQKEDQCIDKYFQER